MMLREIKKLVKHSSIYSIGNLSGHILSFLLLPVYTRLLTAEEYGILALISVFRTILQRILNLGTQSSVVKVYFEVDSDDAQREVISTAFYSVIIFSLFSIAILWLLKDKLSVLLFSSNSFSPLFTFALLASLFYIITTIPLAVFRAKGKALSYSIFAFLVLALGITFNIIFVIILRENVRGVLRSAFLSQAIVFFIVLIVFWKNLIPKFRVKYLMRMLTFGLPLVPSALSLWILTLLDRYFLRLFSSLDVVGVYSLGYKIATIMNMLVIIPFSMAWSPLMLRWQKHKNAKELYGKVFKYFGIFGFFILLVLSVFSREIIMIMTTPVYYDAHRVVYLIVLSYLFHGFYMIFTTGCTLVRRTYFFAIATAVAAIMNTILNLLLIPHFGMMGAAVATVISYFAMMVIMYFFSKKYYRIDFDFSSSIKLFIISGLLYLISIFVRGCLPLSIITKLVLIALFVFMIPFLGILNKGEIGAIRKLIGRRRKV